MIFRLLITSILCTAALHGFETLEEDIAHRLQMTEILVDFYEKHHLIKENKKDYFILKGKYAAYADVWELLHRRE